VFERSQPASQLACFRVNDAKGRRRIGDRNDIERSQPASQLARSGVDDAKGRRRIGDRDDNDCFATCSLWRG
jgi:hypothetical protein